MTPYVWENKQLSSRCLSSSVEALEWRHNFLPTRVDNKRQLFIVHTRTAAMNSSASIVSITSGDLESQPGCTWIPLPIIVSTVNSCHMQNSNCSITVGDMIALAFFFLLRAGECVECNQGSFSIIRIQDVQLFVGNKKVDLLACSDDMLENVTGGGILFGCNVIRLKKAEYYTWCPVRTLTNRLRHLRQQGGTLETPICSYLDGDKWKNVHFSLIKAALQDATKRMGYDVTVSGNTLRTSGIRSLHSRNVGLSIIRQLMRHKKNDDYTP